MRVNVFFRDQYGSGGSENVATTDAQGVFTLLARPGKAQLNIWQLPDEYGNAGGADP